jgi:broad specificity phosphatase PhoE
VATTILLARHGESDWNHAGRWQGLADRPLTELGREQAAALAERLRDTELDAVYSSDLRRARDTAEVVAAEHGLDVTAVPGLREVDVGSWSGLTRTEAQTRFPDGYERWIAGGEGWDDGETYDQLGQRVVAALLQLAAVHEGGRILVVAHGGTIRAIHAAALGIDVSAYRRSHRVEPNGGLSAVEIEEGRVAELSRPDEVVRLVGPAD